MNLASEQQVDSFAGQYSGTPSGDGSHLSLMDQVLSM
jgi:hypothetical protein